MSYEIESICDPGYENCREYRAEIKRLRDALETIAAQNSGIVGSTSKADCMAALALAVLSK